ncbi:MAG: hypothetical protein II987_01945 [Clostridia bacterium]|nr:hypothetical protein [Clostridia bacterium]
MKSVITMFDVPDIITANYYNCIDPFSREGIWQLCYRNLTNNKIALNSLSELSELCFNTETTFPSEWGAQASAVLEDGKSNLINSGKLTGKGVKVAVIDRPINKNHIEFQNRIEYIEVLPDISETLRTDFHGIACASFLSGANCGVAPESKLVYFAIPNKTSPIYDYYNYQLIALQKVIDYNKTNQEPIRIVSLSAPFTNEQKLTRDFLECELKKTGCTLIDATSFGHNFYGVDYIRYQEKGEFLLNQWQIDNYESNKNRKGFTDYFNSLCCVPSSRRTSADNNTNNGYIHWSKYVSESWTIPHVAGAYALCLEAYPHMQFEDFVKLSKLCTKHNNLTILDVNEIIYNYGRSLNYEKLN